MTTTTTAAKTTTRRTRSAKTASQTPLEAKIAASDTVAAPTPLETKVVEAAKPAPKRQRATKQATPPVQTPDVRPVGSYVVDLKDPGTDTEREFEKLLAKSPNEIHHQFAAWFEEKTGESVDVRTVQFVIATYAQFQRSPEHRARTHAKREAAAIKRAQAEQRRVQRAEENLAKAKADLAAKQVAKQA